MVSLSDEVQQLIRSEMAAGHYTSVNELVRRALLTLREQRLTHEAIGEAFDDVAAGRVQASADFDREFRDRKNIGSA